MGEPLRNTSDIPFRDLTQGAAPEVSSPSAKHDGSFTPSPRAWEDLVLYFLLPDRFSNGKETGYLDNDGTRVTGGGTPPFTPAQNGNAVRSSEDAARWRAAGTAFCGGTLAGLASKLGYLSRLGVSALWIGPVLKQVKNANTYHGYAIQNFLDVDPRFGTAEELRQLVRDAHAKGIYVVLDVVINHAANVFDYAPDRYLTWDPKAQANFLDPRWDGREYQVRGFRDEQQRPLGPPLRPLDPGASLDAGVWPGELQTAEAFHRKGRIDNFDFNPEFRDGDFFDLKDLDHGTGPVDGYSPSPALDALCRCYCYWIAYADLDGYRVDTVKHVDDGAARYFASWIHEFTQRIGKDNFYLIGEVAGDRAFAFDRVELTGLDAALGIADVSYAMAAAAKGEVEPDRYFSLFRNSRELGKDSHAWFRDKVATFLDNHDKIGEDPKTRFCSTGDGRALVLNALAMNATTLGIPCIYYGTEQGFDGQGSGDSADRYIRETMFGGEFGAFRSRGFHFFDETHPVYVELRKILAERRRRPALRRGRQYLRPISGDGQSFGLPQRMGSGPIRSLVAWSRILDSTEVVCAMNTDPAGATTSWVTIARGLHAPGDRLTCVYSSDPGQIGKSVAIEARNGLAVKLTVPAAGFAMYQ